MALLEVRDLASGYGDVQILWGASIALEAGRMTCLVGTNGVGKTTLLRTIMGQLKPSAGSVWFEGHDITRLPAHAKAGLGLALVPEGRQLFTDNGCNACHTLADANAAGSVGPSFDGNPNLDKGHVVNVVNNGQGPMPSFAWLGEEDIDLIAAYIVQVKK